MSLSITIDYRPAVPTRKGTTRAIAAALKTLAASPTDAEGNPGSFVVPKKYRGSVRLAATDCGLTVRMVTENEGVRVYLHADSLKVPDNQLPLPYSAK